MMLVVLIRFDLLRAAFFYERRLVLFIITRLYSVGAKRSICPVQHSENNMSFTKCFNIYNAKCLLALYNALVRSMLEYRTVVCSPFTLTNIRRIDLVQKIFFSFAGFTLNIVHAPHDYEVIKQLLGIGSLEEKRKIYGPRL